jgi:hypothetical protein
LGFIVFAACSLGSLQSAAGPAAPGQARPDHLRYLAHQLISQLGYRRQGLAQPSSWRVITMRRVWLLPSQVRVVTVVRSRCGALPEPTGSGGALEHAVAYLLRHRDCAG